MNKSVDFQSYITGAGLDAKPHQEEGVAWILDKETKGHQGVKGGIVADEMGLGKTIQVIPHVTNEIKDFIRIGEDEVDFMLCEIGGTVGDI